MIRQAAWTLSIIMLVELILSAKAIAEIDLPPILGYGVLLIGEVMLLLAAVCCHYANKWTTRHC